jgi:hypothetical protein
MVVTLDALLRPCGFERVAVLVDLPPPAPLGEEEPVAAITPSPVAVWLVALLALFEGRASPDSFDNEEEELGTTRVASWEKADHI